MSVAFNRVLLDDAIWADLSNWEDDEHGVVWQLKNALCGTRRAALLFQEYVIQAMVKIGVHSGACGSTDVPPRTHDQAADWECK